MGNCVSLGMAASCMYGSFSIFSIFPSYRFLCVLLLWLWVPAVGIKPLSLVLFKNNFPLLLPRTEDDLNRWMSLLPSSGGKHNLPDTERVHKSLFSTFDPFLLKFLS